jgi:hypothetical protein
MIVAISVLAGLVLGLLFRWWALVPAVAVRLWVGVTTDVDEVPEWFLGLTYAGRGPRCGGAKERGKSGLADQGDKR